MGKLNAEQLAVLNRFLSEAKKRLSSRGFTKTIYGEKKVDLHSAAEYIKQKLELPPDGEGIVCICAHAADDGSSIDDSIDNALLRALLDTRRIPDIDFNEDLIKKVLGAGIDNPVISKFDIFDVELSKIKRRKPVILIEIAPECEKTPTMLGNWLSRCQGLVEDVKSKKGGGVALFTHNPVLEKQMDDIGFFDTSTNYVLRN